MLVQSLPRQLEALHWRIVPSTRRIVENNRLLAVLPADDYQHLERYLEVVRLEARQMLGSPDQPLRYVYFLRDAVVSLLVPMEDGATAEAATIGNEGIVGLQVFLGGATANEEVVVAVPGEAARLRVCVFEELVRQRPAVQVILHRYTLALLQHMARTAGCNRIHPVDQRLARLLLMCCDRVGRNTFSVTHEFLATMLAVRRASVTEAAGEFQRAGLIEYHRGQITICDRPGLEDASCEDYRLSRQAYDHAYGGRGSPI